MKKLHFIVEDGKAVLKTIKKPKFIPYIGDSIYIGGNNYNVKNLLYDYDSNHIVITLKRKS